MNTYEREFRDMLARRVEQFLERFPDTPQITGSMAEEIHDGGTPTGIYGCCVIGAAWIDGDPGRDPKLAAWYRPSADRYVDDLAAEGSRGELVAEGRLRRIAYGCINMNDSWGMTFRQIIAHLRSDCPMLKNLYKEGWSYTLRGEWIRIEK